MITTTHRMLSDLIHVFGYTTSSIASSIGVNKKTIARIVNKNTKPSLKTERYLINFYCACVLNKPITSAIRYAA